MLWVSNDMIILMIAITSLKEGLPYNIILLKIVWEGNNSFCKIIHRYVCLTLMLYMFNMKQIIKHVLCFDMVICIRLGYIPDINLWCWGLSQALEGVDQSPPPTKRTLATLVHQPRALKGRSIQSTVPAIHAQSHAPAPSKLHQSKEADFWYVIINNIRNSIIRTCCLFWERLTRFPWTNVWTVYYLEHSRIGRAGPLCCTI